MGNGLVTIVSTAAGQDWSNTWGVRVGTQVNGGLTESDMSDLINDALLTNDSTSPAADTDPFEGAQSVLAAIIAFHRLFTYTVVTIKSIYVSDGQNNPGSSVYWTKALGYPCLRALGTGVTEDVIVPLSLVHMINRNPAGFSQKPGRLYMRGALADGAVKMGTRTGVDWATPAIAAVEATHLASSLTGSLLTNWLGVPTDGGQEMIGIPVYGTTDLTEGEVTFVAPISGFSSGGPKSRQLTRGRRRTVSSPGGD